MFNAQPTGTVISRREREREREGWSDGVRVNAKGLSPIPFQPPCTSTNTPNNNPIPAPLKGGWPGTSDAAFSDSAGADESQVPAGVGLSLMVLLSFPPSPPLFG